MNKTNVYRFLVIAQTVGMKPTKSKHNRLKHNDSLTVVEYQIQETCSKEKETSRFEASTRSFILSRNQLSFMFNVTDIFKPVQ